MQRNIIARIAKPSYQACSVPRFYSDSSSAAASKPGLPQEKKEAKFTKNAPLRKAKTPIGKLDELEEGKHPFQEKEPLQAFPNNTNPVTGEIGGPRGPEPTRYGDWERKGRVTDF